MKKCRICTAVLALSILPALCLAQYEKPAATKQDAATTTKAVNQRIVDLEREGWEAIKKKDWNGLGALMTADFVMVDETGIVSGRPEVLKVLADLNLTDYLMEDAKVVLLDRDAALLTYKVTQKGSFKGQAIPPQAFLCQFRICEAWQQVAQRALPAEPLSIGLNVQPCSKQT